MRRSSGGYSVAAYIYIFIYLWSCCDYCYVLENGAFIPPVSPESIVIKQFDLKEGTWEGAEKVLRSCSIKVPFFVHRVHAKPPILRKGTPFPFFVYTLIPSLLRVAQTPWIPSYKKMMSLCSIWQGLWATAQERRYFVFTKEGIRVPSLKTGGLVCTRWTKKQGLGRKCL